MGLAVGEIRAIRAVSTLDSPCNQPIHAKKSSRELRPKSDQVWLSTVWGSRSFSRPRVSIGRGTARRPTRANAWPLPSTTLHIPASHGCGEESKFKKRSIKTASRRCNLGPGTAKPATTNLRSPRAPQGCAPLPMALPARIPQSKYYSMQSPSIMLLRTRDGPLSQTRLAGLVNQQPGVNMLDYTSRLALV